LSPPSGVARDRNCQAVNFKTPLSTPPPTRADAVSAGFYLIGAMLAAGAAGFGLGSLVGLAVPVGLLGLFAGLIAGLVLVHARFRRL
jgi:hypothetical protein